LPIARVSKALAMGNSPLGNSPLGNAVTNMTSAIAISQLSKRFGATIALNEASFSILSGETHALLGENGAGKSTVVKILSGLLVPDSGTISVFDKTVAITNPGAASKLGIETAFQELPQIPDLSVADNLLMPDFPTRLGLFEDRGRRKRLVESILAEFSLEDIDPRAEIRGLDLSLRQKIEITRALARRPKILLLDEPTAALSEQDVHWLGRRIDEVKRAGTTVVLITHRMQEVRQFCDRLTVLRGGVAVGTSDANAITDRDVFQLIVGRAIETTLPEKPVRSAMGVAMPALAARNLKSGHRLNDVDLTLYPNEILGIAALQGMGQLELFTALFGMTPLDRGQIEINGLPARIDSPRQAIGLGISMVPEDRKTQGLAIRQTGRENAALPSIKRYAKLGWIDTRKEEMAVDRVFDRVQLHPRALYKTAQTLSGGNQQKIVLSKCLLAQSNIMLLFDPTRGVDIGTKHEMYRIISDFVAEGGSALFHSTELPELVGLCHRIAVLYRGKIVALCEGDNISEDRIGALMLGASAGNEPGGRQVRRG
jgi:ribose transport system ATP-binding protein